MLHFQNLISITVVNMTDVEPEKSRAVEPQQEPKGPTHVVTHLDVTTEVRDQ